MSQNYLTHLGLSYNQTYLKALGESPFVPLWKCVVVGIAVLIWHLTPCSWSQSEEAHGNFMAFTPLSNHDWGDLPDHSVLPILHLII